MKLYEAVSGLLLRAGVGHLFGVVGDSNIRYITAFAEAGGTYVAAAQEAGATAMADGYSRLSGRVGVATVTRGPGVTNSLTALTEAVRARSQLLVLTGSTPPKREHTQWLDVRAAAALAGAGYRRVETANTAVDDIALALRQASVMRVPVLLDIPPQLLDKEVGELTSKFGFGPWPRPSVEPGDDQFDTAMSVIASAQRPVVLAGRGAVLAGARAEVIRLAEAIHAPVATTVMALGYFSGHPLDLGIFGSESHSAAIRCISQSDCIVVLGAGLNDHTTASGDLLRGKAVVQCDADPATVGTRFPATVSVVGDVRSFARRAADALDSLGGRPETAWVRQLREELAGFDPSQEFVDHSDARFIDFRTAMVELDEVVPRDRALITDFGYFKVAPWRHLRCSADAFTQSGAFGAIGLGLPMAIGACFALPDKVVVAVAGDGGLMMGLPDMATAVEHGLRLVLVVANDSAYGTEYWKLLSYGHDPHRALRPPTRFADLAGAFGAAGRTITSREQLAELRVPLQEMSGPWVLDVRIDPAVDTHEYR